MGHSLLIYGANGATGARLAELAAGAGLTPIVAGRRAGAITELASQLGCEGRVAEVGELSGVLGGVDVVASCVAPYTTHGKPIVRAAIDCGASYLDLTGETAFVRWLVDNCDAPARVQGVTLVPSAGLGLCSAIAARAAVATLPAPAERLTVSYRSQGMRASKGTSQSMIEVLAGEVIEHEGDRVRTVVPGRRLARTPIGVGASFPLTESMLLRALWPGVDIRSYFVVGPAVLAPLGAAAMAAVHCGARMRNDWLRWAAGHAPHGQPGGGFAIAVRAEAAGVVVDAGVVLDDVYEVSSRAMLEVARSVVTGASPGVRGAGAVVAGEPADIAERIGVRLWCGDYLVSDR